MSDTLVSPSRSDTSTSDRERFAHIVNPASKAVEAMLAGTPVTALCGKTWVPKRNPQNFPKCPACVEVCERNGWRVP